MSFQAYLDNIEQKTGKTPRELIEIAKSKGYDDPTVKAGSHSDDSDVLHLDGIKNR